jgi:hypothetical protein
VGFPLFHIDVKVIRSDGSECAADEPGELIVSGTVEELMHRARAHPVISIQIDGDHEIAVRGEPRTVVDRRAARAGGEVERMRYLGSSSRQPPVN